MPTRYDHLRISEEEFRNRASSLGFGEADFRDDFHAVADFTYDWESWHAPDGAVVWVNFAVERVTGYLPIECLAMDDYPLPIIAPEDRPRLVAMMSDAISGGADNDLEFQIVHRGGERRSMAISYQPMYSHARTHLGFRTSVRDINERCELREQNRLYAQHLEQLVEQRTRRIQQLESQRIKMERLAALGQLSARVAHEVNNPLAGIRNAFTLIKSEIADNPKHHRLLDLIDSEIERIGSIVHQMHQLYRHDPQSATSFDMRTLISGIVTLLEGLAANAGVTLEQKNQGNDFTVKLPEGEVKQILYNLIINAVQASSAGKAVTISVGRIGEEMWVRVIDRGTGIEPQIVSQIFDPFFTTKAGGNRTGMGLGLSVSSSLIEAIGGKLEVETKVGHGSCLSAIFPASV